MTTTSMLPSVTLPRFAPSNKSSSAQQSGGTALFSDGDGLDFDMLAEYLLDEGTSMEGDVLGLSAFDFK